MKETNDKILSTLGLARRASRLVYGTETVRGAIQFGKAKLVLLASDLSPKTAESIIRTCENTDTQIVKLSYTMADFIAAAGKPCGVLAITDAGFTKLILKSIQAGLPADGKNAPTVSKEDNE